MRRATRRISRGLALALAAAFSLAAGCGQDAQGAKGGAPSPIDLPPESPAVIGEVGEFHLVDSAGRPFTRAELLGHTWIVSTFFTTCTYECPMLMSGLRELRGTLKDEAVRLLSISVDPTLDTPERLTEYAKALDAAPEKWVFLTGAEAEVYGLLKTSFLLAAGGRGPEALEPTHNVRLVVVDPRGRVRGYYDGSTSEGRARAAERARAVGREGG